MRAARNVAKVQVALETTTREFLREAGDKIRCELAEELDFKTRWVNVIPDWIIVNKQCMPKTLGHNQCCAYDLS